VCTNCAAGVYSSAAGSTVCTGCAAGTYASAVGATVCAECSLCLMAGKFRSGCGGDSGGVCADCSSS
jgi:hypothetical protein